MNAPKTLAAAIPKTEGLLAKGKELVKFYKGGVLNVWNNRKTANHIKSTYAAKDGTQLCEALVELAHIRKLQSQKSSLMPGGQMTREQFLTVLRTERDFFKLPVFGVVFAVFFEFTPLVLAAFPRIAPTTCWSASYRAKLNKAFENNRKQLLRKKDSIDFATSVYKLDSDDIRRLAVTVLPGNPLFYRMAPLSWLKKKLIAHLMQVRADDEFLRNGNILELNDAELGEACRSRALDISLSTQEQQQSLRKWVNEFVEPADAGYFITHTRDEAQSALPGY